MDAFAEKDARVSDGSYIFDGNLWYRSVVNPSTPLFSGWDGNDFSSLSDFKASQLFIDSQTYYAPGWENSGVEADPMLNNEYRPASGSPAATGAVDLSSKGWPGIDGGGYRGVLPAVADCTSGADCNDGQYCNGEETCNLATGQCQQGTPPIKDDGVACTDDSCDEASDSIVNTPNNANCDNGLFCDGSETCDATLDCLAGTPPITDDGVGCTDDSCDEANDVIVHTPNNGLCDNGEFCDGSETCDAVNDCQAGTPPTISDGVGCTDDSCDEVNDVIINTPNHANCPDDGEFCNGTEYCDDVSDCSSTGDPCLPGEICNDVTDTCDQPTGGCGNGLVDPGEECDDGNTTPGDGCDENCMREPLPSTCNSDADCDNGLFCDGIEFCKIFQNNDNQCRRGTPVKCAAGELCNEIIDQCVPQQSVCGNGIQETGEDCDDGAANGTTTCGCQTDCTYTAQGTACEDGEFCTSGDTCTGSGSCSSGGPTDCSDGVGCTDDSCDEANDTCVNTPNNANCDNGLFCDGAETCDTTLDCLAGTPPIIDDGVGCTDDSCDEANDVIVHTPNNGLCDNSKFCDGSETCDVVNDCQAGTPPVIDDGVGCTDDSCDEVNDTVVHAPNDGLCDNGDFCNGLETCDTVNDCVAGPEPCDPQTEICDEPTDQCLPIGGCQTDSEVRQRAVLRWRRDL
jgi:hypothetical protein